MRRLTSTLAALAVVLGGSIASAQKNIPVQKNARRIQIAGGPIILGRTSSRTGVNLLRDPAIQAELKLDDDQKAEIAQAVNDLARKRREEYAKIDRNLPIQQRLNLRLELSQKLDKASTMKVKEILEPEQLNRLHQIEVQMMGIQTLFNSAIQKKLKITDEQKARFAEIQTSLIVSRRDAIKNLRANGRLDNKKYREANRKLIKEREERLHAVLTKEQRAQFDKMKGKKFDLPRRAAAGRTIRLRIQGGPGGKIQIRPVKPGDAKPAKEAERKEEKKAGGK